MRAGPITMPPPIPNIPASTPAASPIAMKRITVCRVEDKSSSSISSGNPPFDGVQHLVGEDVDLVERRVHVRRNANSLEFRMHDWRVDDPVLIEQPGAQLDVVDTFDLEERNRTGLPVVERSENRHAWTFCHESLRPSITQIAQTRDLAIGADP